MSDILLTFKNTKQDLERLVSGSIIFTPSLELIQMVKKMSNKTEPRLIYTGSASQNIATVIQQTFDDNQMATSESEIKYKTYAALLDRFGNSIDTKSVLRDVSKSISTNPYKNKKLSMFIGESILSIMPNIINQFSIQGDLLDLLIQVETELHNKVTSRDLDDIKRKQIEITKKLDDIFYPPKVVETTVTRKKRNLWGNIVVGLKSL